MYPDFEPDQESTPKQKKYEYCKEFDIDDKLPFKYRHLRSSMRAEVYEVMTKLKSTYHMSETQADAAIIEVGNNLFGSCFLWPF